MKIHLAIRPAGSPGGGRRAGPYDEASKLIVNGFVEPIIKELPMEYAVEMNPLIELQMEGSIG
ncbi:MAG: hypothetical protein ACJ780_13615 [Solirubrobacteraceae bacterium]